MFNELYRKFLRFFRLQHTITYTIQHEQQAEPLVLMLVAAALGILWGSSGNFLAVVRDCFFLALGILLGHLFWGINAKR